MKSGRQGVPATKSTLQAPQSTAPALKSGALQGLPSTAPATVLRLPRNPHIKVHTTQACQGDSHEDEHFQRQRQDAKTQLSLETSSEL